MTADEVMFAGGINGAVNSTFYLNKNAVDTMWWTLSPSHFSGSLAFSWFVNSTGQLNRINVNNTGALRPSIALLSTTTVTGLGTSANPYIVS